MNQTSSFLMRRSDWLTLVFLTALSLCYFLMLRWQLWWLIPVACVLCVSACAAKHNHTHCQTFGSRGLNRLMDFWLTALTGTSTAGIRVAHQILHHGKNQSPDDFVRCSLVSDLSPGRALLKFVPLVIREVWKTNAQNDANRHRLPALDGYCFQERLFLWCFIVVMFVLFGPWVFIAMGLPWGFGQWFLIAMNLPQHDGCDAGSDWAHSRNVTGRWANWLFLNNGYHTAHHHWPAKHWSELPSLHVSEVAAHLPSHLTSNSLVGFWASWWRERSKGGCQ